MSHLFSDDQIDELAGEVEAQLRHLRAEEQHELLGGGTRSGDITHEFIVSQFPSAQRQVVEQQIDEPLESFWKKFKRHARRDMCLPGGRLYEHWQKWNDLPSKDAIKLVSSFLVGCGISGAALPGVAIALAVIVINSLAGIGLKAFCEGCEPDPDQAPASTT